jgi:hypothetical protein
VRPVWACGRLARRTLPFHRVIAAVTCLQSDLGHTKRQYLCVNISTVHDSTVFGLMIPIFSQHGRLLGLEPMDWLVLVVGIACAAVVAAAVAY